MEKNGRKVEMKFFVDGKEVSIKELTFVEMQTLSGRLTMMFAREFFGDPTKGVSLNPNKPVGGLG